LCFNCDAEVSQPLRRDATDEELADHAEEWTKLIEKSH
jgi:hypothetical protein